ncbi:signal peptidase II [soil metagenome]
MRSDDPSPDRGDPSTTVGEPFDDTGDVGVGPHPGEAHAGPRQLGVILVVALTVLVGDQVTKEWALRALTDGRTIDVVGSLRWNLAFNTGTAFSMGSDQGLGPWISVLAIGVVVGLSLGYPSRFRLGAVAAGLIAGGAVGNLADRAFRGDDGLLQGAVVDFIDLQWWPVFNVADMAIVVGAILLVGASLRSPGP